MGRYKSVLNLLLGLLIAVLSVQAGPLAGKVWLNVPEVWLNPPLEPPNPEGYIAINPLPSATFGVQLPPAAGATLFLFSEGNPPTHAAELDDFLRSRLMTIIPGADYVARMHDWIGWCTLCGQPGGLLYGSIFTFEGSSRLLQGHSYFFDHDDGVMLIINGSLMPGLSPGLHHYNEREWFTWTNPDADVNIQLIYTQIGLPSAALQTDIFTPEPAAWLLVGCGLALFALRRRAI